MKDLEIKFKMVTVSEESSDEVRILMVNELATKEEIKKHSTDSYIYCEEIQDNKNTYLDAEPIPIDIMKKMIDKAEKKGANYVSIDWHCDHQEYEVYGLKIVRATKDVLEAEELRLKVKKEKSDKVRIANLEKQLKKLKGE